MSLCARIDSQTGSLIPDYATPLESCSMVLVSGSEYTALSRVLITDAADAAEIAAAFAMLFAVVGVYRILRRMIEESDVPSDEKH